MNSGRAMAGAASGLLLAAVLIVGVSLAGGGSLHLDLVRTNGQTSSSTGLAVQSGQVTPSESPPTAGQTTKVTTSSASISPISSVHSLSSEGGGSIGLLLMPVALGALLGAIFYGAYSRRVEAE